MAVSSSVPASALELIVDRYESLLDDLSKAKKDREIVARELLLLRDRLAVLLREAGTFETTVIARISALDQELRRSRGLLGSDSPKFENLRCLVSPPKRNWWWYRPSPNPAWTVAALFLLTVSVAILTDFTRRLLNSGPDEIGLLSIAVQALFAVGATSTFTSAGREAMDRFLVGLGVAGRYRPVMKLWATLVLFVIVFCAWKFLPNRLANYYNDIGFRRQSSDPDAARAYYAKAISLNPGNIRAHFNLGALYENAYEYDKAAVEYRRAIVIEPNHVRAYSNLSRLLLMGNDPMGALQVADDALKRPATEGHEITAALYRNRALAEYQMGLYQQAETDAKLSSKAQSNAADPYCVLAKIYSKQDRAAEVRSAWQDFRARLDTTVLQPRVEPDCVHLAAEALHADH